MKYTLITGGSQGLGESLVLEFAKHNHNIIIGYNTNKEKAEKLNEYIKTNYKVESIIKKIDITNEENIKDIFNNYDVEILVNNASICCDNYIEEKSYDEFINVKTGKKFK